MITKRAIFATRPFQPFLAASKDLLALALPLFQQIQDNRGRYEQSGVIEPFPQDVWRREKSLSIGSFLAEYCGLEALVNCVHKDFGERNIDQIRAEFFVPPLDKHRSKLRKNNFSKWRLDTRVYLLPPLCSDPVEDPRCVWNLDSYEWKAFQEIIEIRHSFNHASEVQEKTTLTKAGPKLWIVDDQNPDNYWPVTKAPKNHRIFNYQTAKDLNEVLEKVIQTLRNALSIRLTDKYMTEEQALVE